MNTAARLETAAAPGEVLVGEPTYRLIRDAVAAEKVEPLELKGKAGPITAHRLVGVASLSPIRTRRLDAPGRRGIVQRVDGGGEAAPGRGASHWR